MKIELLILSLFAFATSSAQNLHLRDSLISNLQNAEADSAKERAMGGLYFYYYAYNRDSADYYGTKVIELARATNNTRLLYKIYGYLATQSRNEGNYMASLEWSNKMLDLGRENNDTRVTANTLNNIGNLYKDQKLYDKAIAYYLDCKQLSEDDTTMISVQNLVFANMNMGYVYEQMGKIDSALFYAQSAYLLAIKSNDKESLGFIYCCLGNIQLTLNNRELALEYYKMGIASLPKEEDTYSCMLYSALGRLYTGIDIDTAIHYARKSLAIATAISNVKSMAESAKLLSEIFVVKNNKDSAFQYQTLYLKLYDSLNNRERIAQFENLNFNEALKQQEKKEALRQATEKRTYNIQLVIITLAILFIVMLFLVIGRSIIVSHKLVAFLSIVVLLILFEFINLLLHPILEHTTNDKPLPMLLAMVVIAALIVPLHNRLQKWTSKKMVAKNKAIRLANAKKVIEELEQTIENDETSLVP